MAEFFSAVEPDVLAEAEYKNWIPD